MKLGIICAMEEELRTLRAALPDEHETIIANQHFFTGTLNGVAVVLVESGIGKVQAGLTAAVMLDQFNPSALINTGSAGGIGAGLQIGEVVVSDAVAYHDVDATAFGYAPGQLPGQPERFEADRALVGAINTAAEAVGLAHRVGLIVSGDQFVHSQAQIAAILKQYPDALAAEMEGAAIGQVATQFGTPFAVIRAMSDNGNADAAVNFDDFILAAGKQSAAMVQALTTQLGKD